MAGTRVPGSGSGKCASIWYRQPCGSCAMHSSTRAWLVRKPQLAAPIDCFLFWKYIASF
jgi:hypothetical protein